jgi:hypothetical protein
VKYLLLSFLRKEKTGSLLGLDFLLDFLSTLMLLSHTQQKKVKLVVIFRKISEGFDL